MGTTRIKVVTTIVSVAAVCAALTRVIWPQPAGSPIPPSALVPYFVALNILGCLLFGAGAAFVLFGYRALKRARQPRWLTVAAYLAIAFLLLNWWPHSNLHAVSGMDFSKVVLIDYGFHLPLMAAGVIMALFFMRMLYAPGSSR